MSECEIDERNRLFTITSVSLTVLFILILFSYCESSSHC